MRVLVISHACAAPINREKVHALARRPGLEVSLLLPRLWREGGRRLATEEGVEAGVRIFAGAAALPGRVGGHFYLSGLVRALREARPDVIHLEEEPYALVTAQVMAAALLRPEAALVIFSWENLDLSLSWPRRLTERAALRRAQVLLAGGRTCRERLIRRGAEPGRVEVLHQFGLDPEVFRPAAPGERAGGFSVGFAGRLAPGKGVDLLLRALGALEGDWRAVIVGDGPERAALEGLAAELGLTGRVAFAGWLDHREVPAFLRRLDVLVLPSRTTATWAEQFGHVLIEAMGCGVVPVGSDSGEIPHVIGAEGLVFPEGDAPALAAALRSLRDAPDLRARLAEAGRRRALAEFTWGVLAERTHALYARALAARQAARQEEGRG